SNVKVTMQFPPLPAPWQAPGGATICPNRAAERSGLSTHWLFGGFGPDLDLLAGRLEALGADLQIDPRLIDRLQRILQRQVAVLQKLQLLIQPFQRLLICQLLAHGSTCSTRAARRPVASRMRSLRSTAGSDATRTTAPDSASCVMLYPRESTASGLSARSLWRRCSRPRVATANRSVNARSSRSAARRDASALRLRVSRAAAEEANRRAFSRSDSSRRATCSIGLNRARLAAAGASRSGGARSSASK